MPEAAHRHTVSPWSGLLAMAAITTELHIYLLLACGWQRVMLGPCKQSSPKACITMEACVGSWHSRHSCPAPSSPRHGQQTYLAPRAVHLAACQRLVGSQHGMRLDCSHLGEAMNKATHVQPFKSNYGKGWKKRWLYKGRDVCDFTTLQHDSSN
jgi:hypothetical protein